MRKSIMAIGAHADDIELRVGGTLAKYQKAGYAISYVMSTNNFAGGELCFENGERTVHKHPPTEQMLIRKAEAGLGAECYNTTPVHWDFPQRQYNRANGTIVELRYGCEKPSILKENIPSILTAHEDENAVEMVKDYIVKVAPEVILTHGMEQKDLEHVATCLLVTKAYWKAVEEDFEGSLLHWRNGFSWLGKCNSIWDTHVDVMGYLEKKKKAAQMHQSQAPVHMPTFIESCFKWGKACGCEAAEIFVVVNMAKSVSPGSLTEELANNLSPPKG